MVVNCIGEPEPGPESTTGELSEGNVQDSPADLAAPQVLVSQQPLSPSEPAAGCAERCSPALEASPDRGEAGGRTATLENKEESSIVDGAADAMVDGHPLGGCVAPELKEPVSDQALLAETNCAQCSHGGIEEAAQPAMHMHTNHTQTSVTSSQSGREAHDANDLASGQANSAQPDASAASPAAVFSSEEAVATDSAAVAAKAESLQVVWARVKGYPAWPAQIMSEEGAEKWLKQVRPGKGQTLPIMFFGTFEICWLSQAAVEPWSVGVGKGYLDKAKKDRRLPASVKQAEDFLLGRVHAQWWWQPKKAAGPNTAAAKAGKQHQKSAFGRNGESKLGVRPEGKVTKPRQNVPMRGMSKTFGSQTGGRVGGAMEPRLDPQGGAVAAADDSLAALLAPKRKSFGASRLSNTSTATIPGQQAPLDPSAAADMGPPKYEYTKKNIWPGYLSRPKRMPRDAIPVCDCCPLELDAGIASQSGVLDSNRGRPDRSGLAKPSEATTAVPLERSMRARTAVVQEQGKADCGPDCMNRQSYVHCDVKTCPCGERCTNRPFYLLPLPKMTVYNTGDRGWGVRADELILQGTFIVEYAGELINRAEKQQRLEEQARTQVLDFYMMEHSPGIIIDARLKGNLARLINSSCEPNCETQKWRDAATDEGRIGIFAKRDIDAGEELEYDYNFEHSGLAEQAGAYRCKCGAATCRGTMDTQPDRLKDAYRRIEVFWDGDERFYRGTVLGYQATAGMHAIQYDDGQRTKEKLWTVKHRWLPDDTPCSAEGQLEDSMPDLPIIEPSSTEQDLLPLKKRKLGGTQGRGRKKAAPAGMLPAQNSAPHSTSSAATDFHPCTAGEARPAVDSKEPTLLASCLGKPSAINRAVVREPSMLMSILQRAATIRADPALAAHQKQEQGLHREGLLDAAAACALDGPHPITTAAAAHVKPEPIIRPAHGTTAAGSASLEGSKDGVADQVEAAAAAPGHSQPVMQEDRRAITAPKSDSQFCETDGSLKSSKGAETELREGQMQTEKVSDGLTAGVPDTERMPSGTPVGESDSKPSVLPVAARAEVQPAVAHGEAEAVPCKRHGGELANDVTRPVQTYCTPEAEAPESALLALHD